jgi:hypothetical protein
MQTSLCTGILSVKSACSLFEIGDRFAETFGYICRVAGFSVYGNRNYAPGGNRSSGGFLEDREFEGKTGVSNIAYTRVDMQGFIEKSSPFILAICLDVKKIRSINQKIVIFVPDRLEVFDQPSVEIGEIVAEENMPLHVGFNVSDLDGGEEFEMVFQFRPPFQSGWPAERHLKHRRAL